MGPAADAVVFAPGTITGTITTGVPVREFVGSLTNVVRQTQGRLPQRPGEAIAAQGAAIRLGLLQGAGPVFTSMGQAAVVGVVDISDTLDRFSDTVLIQAPPYAALELRFVYVAAEKTTDVAAIRQFVEATIRATDPGQIVFETSEGVIALQNVISGQLGASARQLMAGILGIGVVVVGVTMLGMVSTKRRDFGRRRALGASRSAIIVLVLVQALLAASVGAFLGTGIGAVIVKMTTENLPTMGFIVGLATLTILAGLLGSIPPAILAALRDPVRILRVP